MNAMTTEQVKGLNKNMKTALARQLECRSYSSVTLKTDGRYVMFIGEMTYGRGTRMVLLASGGRVVSVSE